MQSAFGSKPVLATPVDPIRSEIPRLRDAEIAAIFYGQRMGGDFYDFLRVNPSRVLFGLLDVAGRRDQNREILSAAQQTFRALEKISQFWSGRPATSNKPNK